MAEDPRKNSQAPEQGGLEQSPEHSETPHEYLARKSAELETLVASIKAAGSPEFHQAIFAQLDRVVDKFREKGSHFIENSSSENTARAKIRAEFDLGKDELLQHSDTFIGFEASSAPAETQATPKKEAAPVEEGEADDNAVGDSFEKQIHSVNVRVKEALEEADDDSDEEEVQEEADGPEVVEVNAEDGETTFNPDDAEDAEYQEIVPEPTGEKTKMETLEAELGYLNIHPEQIFNKLEKEQIEVLKGLMNELLAVDKELSSAQINLEKEKAKKKMSQEELDSLGDKIIELKLKAQAILERIENFYAEQIRNILEAEGKQDQVDEEQIKAITEKINCVVLGTVEMEANRLAADSKLKGMAKQLLKTSPWIIGTSLAIGSIGLPIAVTGLIAGGTSWAIRRIVAERSKKSAPKLALEQEQRATDARAGVLAEMFSEENLEKFRQQLSGHISNALRQETSQIAGERLKAVGASENGILVQESRLDDVTKEFYLSALTQVEAKYPELTPDQRNNMALQLAMNLAQHARTQNEAATRLAEIKAKKPGLYKIIEKYNLLSAGGSLDEAPADMTEEEKKIWGLSKYDLLSFGIGGATGMAVRSSGVVRAALGAIAGGSLGYALGEEMARKKEAKGFAEIEAMITEAEGMIQDISFPAEKLNEVARSRDTVQARLETGILDSNPLLKSRAENFIHLVRQTEMANQQVFERLLSKLNENAEILQAQIDLDLKRIEKATKTRKIVTTVGGAVLGGLGGFFGADISKKALEGLDDTVGHLGLRDEVDSILNKVGVEVNRESDDVPASPDQERHGGSDWKDDETDPWKTGRESTGETDTTPVVEKPVEPTAFADKIDSAQVSGSDSIWKSTKLMFTEHAKDLGYQGDPAGIDKWAETQTANAVARLTQEQGGNLTDLVHDGDMVHLEKSADGAWKLRLEEASGIKASHLADTNVDKFFANTKFQGDIQHESGIDPRTGDQYWEIKSDEGSYKVFDWDRDGRPNVQMPDGSSTEMSVGELQSMFEQKDLVQTQAELDAEASNSQPELATSPEAQPRELSAYELAAGDPAKQEALFHQILESKDPAQIETYLKDYLGHNGFSGNKAEIFLSTLRDNGQIDHTLNGLYDPNSQGGMELLERLRAQFDASVKTNYDTLHHVNSDEWHPIKIGE
ncbi:hypothetical protein C4566_00005, partial [Candidatus Parcubacteria bacterium]